MMKWRPSIVAEQSWVADGYRVEKYPDDPYWYLLTPRNNLEAFDTRDEAMKAAERVAR